MCQKWKNCRTYKNLVITNPNPNTKKTKNQQQPNNNITLKLE